MTNLAREDSQTFDGILLVISVLGFSSGNQSFNAEVNLSNSKIKHYD